MKQDDYKPLMYFGGLILGYYFIVKPILEKVGITKGSETLRADEIESMESAKNPFSPRYYKQFKKATLLNNASAKSLSKKIYDSLGNLTGDDETAIYGVFRSLKSKTQVSYLAETFQGLYGKDLFGFLRNAGKYYYGGLNDTELGIVLNIVDKLKTN